MLRIVFEIMKELFVFVLSKIVEYIKDFIGKDSVKGFYFFFFVGGFVELLLF